MSEQNKADKNRGVVFSKICEVCLAKVLSTVLPISPGDFIYKTRKSLRFRAGYNFIRQRKWLLYLYARRSMRDRCEGAAVRPVAEQHCDVYCNACVSQYCTVFTHAPSLRLGKCSLSPERAAGRKQIKTML